MKALIFNSSLLLLLFPNHILFAQTEAADKAVGFGGPSFMSTRLAGKWAVEVGGLGGAFVNNHLYIGGGGYALSQKKNACKYDMGYGGLMIGCLWKGEKRTGMNFYVLGGYGGITEKDQVNKNGDDFWTVKPALEVDLLLTYWWRLGIGGGYRLVKGSDISSLGDRDLSAPFAGITFRFGNWERQP
ncbi:MAG: hypothetical protein MI975_21100 [Cytophagales bacterium]|nr:hypothetical protein [Cytophagales bacterium]